VGTGEFLPWEFPLSYWIEQQGYDVSYISNIDTHVDGPGLQRAKATGEALPLAMVAALRKGRRRFGGYIVHAGVIVIAIGVAASSAYRVDMDMTIRMGDTKSFSGYDITYVDTERQDEPHRWSRVARFDVARDGKPLGRVEPRLNHYKAMNQAIGTPAVLTALDEDLYMSLVQVDVEAGLASVSLVVEPLVVWIWIGGGVMLLGTLLAAWPMGRRREDEEAA
jgi:cytochrome c-type biogenesis protein CcmF